jgi:formate hydrogenlyase subunit 3/multisubunit Na+/H+ antiporter MnhD subunit
MMNEIQYMIIIPILIGLILFIIPNRYDLVKKIISIFTAIVTCYLSFRIFNLEERFLKLGDLFQQNSVRLFGTHLHNNINDFISFNIDNLSKLIVLFIGLFGFLVLCYSLIYNKSKNKDFYSYYLITLGTAFGAVLSDNLLVFITFWGLLGITLYKLIPGVNEDSSAAAKKTLIIIGASDGIMILGIAMAWRITGELNMSAIQLPTNNGLNIFIFLTLIIGCFAKSGAFPFHSWVPDFTQFAPASSSAYLPASLDKLLGIYFLARVTTHLFMLTDYMRLLLLSLGVITIISAVLMALIQHNYKRLLGFHAVSQVGYMILGFSIGSLIGVAAGLFHMLNNAIYKSGLFLTAGSIEFRTGKENLDELGGLSKPMPITFVAAMIFALSISGIPPLNGFASKWMIYQGIIDFGSGDGIANKMWIVWLGLAVLGSALTLASFIKFIGGSFLNRQNDDFTSVHEVPLLMWMPMVILAVLCVVFGVFATNFIVPRLLMPVTGEFQFIGFFDSSFISLLVFISIMLGILIYMVSGSKKFRTEENFIGGESFHDKTGFPVTEFYQSIRRSTILSWFYTKAEKRYFDLYDLSKSFTLGFSNILRTGHTGILTSYAFWVLSGLMIMLLIMI